MKIAVIIPARYASTRFPGKVLIDIKTKPLIQWVYEAAAQSGHVNEVIVATDDKRIYDVISGFNGIVKMTSPDARTGSDRCAEIAEKIDAEIIINLQGDELLKGPEIIDELISLMTDDPSVRMGTLKREISSSEEILDRNVVKVVTDHEDYALYFSRAPIPFIRDRGAHPAKTFYKHLGIYAYRRDFLLLFPSLPASRLEDLEKLEQLRVLEAGFRIKVKETCHESYRIDAPEDVYNLQKVMSYGSGT